MLMKIVFLIVLLVTFNGIYAQETEMPQDKKLVKAVPVTSETSEAPPAPDAPSKPIGNVTNGKAIYLPKPAYPRAARAERAAGKVSVKLKIDEKGNVISATAVSGHPLLYEASEAAAKNALFSPTLLDGKPVIVSGIISYNFIPANSFNDRALEMGFFLAIVRSNHPSPGTNIQDVVEKFAKKVPPELGVEPLIFDELRTAGDSERPEVISKLSEALRRNMMDEEKWHFEMGEHLSNMASEINRLNRGEGNAPIDISKIKAELKLVEKLLASIPPEAQADIPERFSNIAAFLKETDLATKTNLQALMTAINARL